MVDCSSSPSLTTLVRLRDAAHGLWVGLEELSIADDDSALITARVHALDALTALSVIEARSRRTAPQERAG